MSPEITILLPTLNKLTPKWQEYHKEQLLLAADGQPIIIIAPEPQNWAISLVDDGVANISNIYRQMLRGAKLATAPYVGIAEDDTLYPPKHFDFRPPLDTFAYNKNRFNVFAWGTPRYFWKDRMSNSTLIAPRQLLIDALEERFAKWPNGTPVGITGELGRGNIEDKLGVSRRKSMWFETDLSVVRIDHRDGVDRLSQTKRKGMGPLKAFDMPHWGRAKDIIAKFK